MNFQHANENYGHLCCFKAKSREKNFYWKKIAVKGINYREEKTESRENSRLRILYRNILSKRADRKEATNLGV